jgi:hypothetical protein
VTLVNTGVQSSVMINWKDNEKESLKFSCFRFQTQLSLMGGRKANDVAVSFTR